MRGRHNRPLGYMQDMEKLNLAIEYGWHVLRYPRKRGSADIDYGQLRRVLGLERPKNDN